jgi:hypothetical protein
MIKILLVHKIIAEMVGRFPLNNNDLEITKNELMYKSIKELEKILEKIKKENE